MLATFDRDGSALAAAALATLRVVERADDRAEGAPAAPAGAVAPGPRPERDPGAAPRSAAPPDEAGGLQDGGGYGMWTAVALVALLVAASLARRRRIANT
jgi:hypothetical protein